MSDKITIALPPSLRNTVETECRDAWRQLNILSSTNDTASPFVPYDEFSRSMEGRTHLWLLDVMFYIPHSIPGTPRRPYARQIGLSELNLAMSRVQARRYNTQGRRKEVSTRAASATEYRKFRSWWLSSHIAAALGAEFNEPCPFKKHTDDGPTESYIEMGKHFEEWTGHKIPAELWAELKADEAKRVVRQEKLAA